MWDMRIAAGRGSGGEEGAPPVFGVLGVLIPGSGCGEKRPTPGDTWRHLTTPAEGDVVTPTNEEQPRFG
eukprot:1191406-Prorocentrum_minimum.AAC.2